MPKVHCCPCARGADAWAHAYELLKELYAASSPRLHEWVDTADEADVILLCNPGQKDGDASLAHPLRLKYPDKVFLLSEQWTPEPRFAGIYANAPRKTLWRGRFRTGSYALHHPDFKNPYIQRFRPEYLPPPEARDLLFSFAGRDCHPVRATLFKTSFRRADIVIRDTSHFDAFKHSAESKDAGQRDYFDLCVRSRFILCPRGVGPGSIRLFEALRLGIAPIIVSDDWIPCEGPAWDRFAIFVAERDIGQVADIAAAHENEFVERGREARSAHDAFFSSRSYFNYLVSAALSIRRSRLLSERTMLRIEPALDFCDRIKARLRRSRPLVATGAQHSAGSALPASAAAPSRAMTRHDSTP